LKSATVTNNLSVSITNTTGSLIAINGTGVDDDVTFTSTNGYAEIAIPTTNGMQPNSSYTFFPAFNVVNNTVASRNITLSATGTPATGVTMTYVDVAGAPIPASTPLAAAGTLSVGIRFDMDTTATPGSKALSMTVGAQ
jgi:hypothetical protein